MSRRVPALLAFLVLAAGLAAAGAGPAPWPSKMWKPVGGRWQAEGVEYAQSNERVYGAWSLWEGGRFVDVDVRVRFWIEKAGKGVKAAGIVFRAVDERHFFFAHFDSRNDQLLITRWSPRTRGKHLARVPRIGLKQETWHEGRVRCIGSKVRVYLDGRLIGQAGGVAEVAGKVGVRAGQGRVRFKDWHVTGESAKAQAKRAKAPWWNAAWRWRMPVDAREPGLDDRQAALASARVDFGGRARGSGQRRDGSFEWTDVVVVDAEGRRVPSLVAALDAIWNGNVATITRAEVRFPVRVGWFATARHSVYFGNPKAPQPKEVLDMGVMSLAAMSGKGLPKDWRFAGGKWERKPLVRPERNLSCVAAVKSERHVAFPGICLSKKGTLLVVYREGYSHASGNPDDGRVMLVRSTDKGRTWGKPELVTDDPTMDDRNASIACMNGGTLVVLWDKYLKGADGRRQHHWAWMATSTDEGHTWSVPMKVSRNENVHTRSRVLDLGNGKWLVPYSESTGSKTASSFFAIYDPKTKAFDEIAATPLGQRNIADETAVARAPNGDLVAFIRSNWDPTFWQITSKDDGRTWPKGHWSSIPSQFTPCDLIALRDGRLLCSFSFRERRNERLVLSRDNGATWDVEDSLDVFDGTMAVGGDRSYPASVQLDDETVGTVLYETRTPPVGGHIWFVTTKLAVFDAPKESVLYQGDTGAKAAFALWPAEVIGATVEAAYRFTGRFGPPPNRVGLLLDFTDERNYTALDYQMGPAKDRRSTPTNYVELVRCVDGKRTASQGRAAQGDWFNDGNIHRLGARHAGGKWTFTIDGIDQLAVPESTGKPCGIVVRRATVAVYEVSWSDRAVQSDARPLEVTVGQIEERPEAER